MAVFARPTTVRVKFDKTGIVRGSEIFEALALKRYFARSVQRSDETSYFCSFVSPITKAELLRMGTLRTENMNLFFSDADVTLTYVTVFNSPYQLENFALEKHLEKYGNIVSSMYGHLQGHPEVQNGLRHFRMVMPNPIPSWIFVGKFSLMVKYEGQAKTCRKCDSPNHLAHDCHSTRCFNCGKVGHISSSCEEILRCSLCKAASHITAECKGWVAVRDNELNPDETQAEDPSPQVQTDQTPILFSGPTESKELPAPKLPTFNFTTPSAVATPRFNLFSKSASALTTGLQDISQYLKKIAEDKKSSSNLQKPLQATKLRKDKEELSDNTEDASEDINDYESDASFFSTGSKRSHKSSEETVKSVKVKKKLLPKKKTKPWK